MSHITETNNSQTPVVLDKHAMALKRNTLIETNKLAGWTNDVLMKEMDKFAYARSMFLFSIVTFFLGNNLNMFLWFFIVITIYILILRIIRFWVKRWLLYLFEFCYFGLTWVVLYLVFYQHNKMVWTTMYVYSTGTMSVAIFLFNNQAHFDSTDHISSVWMHSMPLITCWAIRWKEIIYPEAVLKLLTFNLLSEKEMLITTNEERIRLLLVQPILFWLSWCAYYVIIFYIGFSSCIDNPSYFSGLTDFVGMGKKTEKLFGNPKEYTKIKYLLQHLLIFVLSMPLSWLSYHSFYFNTGYVITVILYLIRNAETQHNRILENKITARFMEEERLQNQKKVMV